jgi:hypothetical protein
MTEYGNQGAIICPINMPPSFDSTTEVADLALG